MAYVNGRLIHDADSHLMELSDCLNPYFDKRLLERYLASEGYRVRADRRDRPGRSHEAHEDPAFKAGVEANILLRKNYEAHGSFRPQDRPQALDLLGFASQLVFTTFCLGNFGFDQGDDMDLAYGAADAHNRMMTDFCSVDRRLLATAYIPLEDFARAEACAREAIRLGAKALMVPSKRPQHHSISHTGLFPVWALAQDAGIPVVFHVGGEEKLDPVWKINGLPPVPDFHGGDDNFTSVSYMPIPNAAMQAMATLIFDGILDRYPRLKWGAIELGAAWLPGWMRSMDSAAHAFVKNEERLKRLSAKPSEIVQRQIRVAPYPHEDAGWIINQAGEGVCLFSSDYPHIEGGRNPLKRFDEALAGATREGIRRFYADNFIDLMGAGLDAALHHPPHLQAA